MIKRTNLILVIFISSYLISCGKDDDPVEITQVKKLTEFSKIEIPKSYAKLNTDQWRVIDATRNLDGEPIATLYFTEDKTSYVNVFFNDNIRPSGVVNGIINGFEFDNQEFDVDTQIEKNTNLPYIFTLSKTIAGNEITILISFFEFSLGSAEFTVSGTDAVLNGTLGANIWNTVLDLNNNYPKVNNIILENVPGSADDDVNLKAAYLIREAGYSTTATPKSRIASGGVDFLLAGKKRFLPNQWDSNEYGLFVHSWCCVSGAIEPSELPENAKVHEKYINYSEYMLGENIGREFYFFTINAAPSSDIHRMTQNEIELYQIRKE